MSLKSSKKSFLNRSLLNRTLTVVPIFNLLIVNDRCKDSQEGVFPRSTSRGFRADLVEKMLPHFLFNHKTDFISLGVFGLPRPKTFSQGVTP